MSREMQILRQEAAAARALAAGADKDVAEYRAEMRKQTDLINLTRQDMGTLRDEVRSDLNDLRTEMVGRFDQVHAGMEQIVSMLGRLGPNRD